MKYRKKPVVIDAVLWDGSLESFVKIADLHRVPPQAQAPVTRAGFDNICIHTLEGDMIASKGDMVIRGVQGELYPCKPDIFEQTYEKVED